MRHISITAVTEIYIKYTGKAISDKTLIRLKFGSKPFVDNELYKIHCNLSYLGGYTFTIHIHVHATKISKVTQELPAIP